MKAITGFFLSLRTTFGLFALFILLAVAGSFQLTGNLAFFSGIDDTPLFRWLADTGNLKLTWWIYGMILLFAVLAINTLFCAYDGIIKKSGGRNVLARLSPQIMHLGVLLIMLGHLLTASMGFKMDMLLSKGETKKVTPSHAVYVEDIRVQADANGYHTGWEIRLQWSEDGRTTATKTLKPVHPLYFGQFGLYSKSVSVDEKTAALIRVCRDPGALWALLGAVTMSIGGLSFMYARFRT